MTYKSIVTDEHGVPHEQSSSGECDVKMVLAKTGPIDVDRPRSCSVLADVEGNLFNPLTGHNYGKRRDGQAFFSLKRCSPKCYLSYTEFLRSRSHTRFIIASREFLSGGCT